jgi:hypothetical protein
VRGVARRDTGQHPLRARGRLADFAMVKLCC